VTILKLSSSALAFADPLNEGLNVDGLFAPPPERPELPAVILEAQMAASCSSRPGHLAGCSRLS
jgi:hypothetical protein